MFVPELIEAPKKWLDKNPSPSELKAQRQTFWVYEARGRFIMIDIAKRLKYDDFLFKILLFNLS